MAPVRGGVEDHIVRPALDAAVERRLQRFVAAVALIEGQIVRIDDEAAIDAGQIGHQEGQVVDILAVDFDKRAIHAPLGKVTVHSLDQRRFSGPASAPQQGIVRRHTADKGDSVGKQRVSLVVNATQQPQIDTVDLGDGCQATPRTVPNIG